MKAWIARLRSLPLRWRITVWVSALLCALFLLHNTVQYIILNQWASKQEETSLMKSLAEVQRYYADEAPNDVLRSKPFLEKVNQPNQMIRLIDAAGSPVVTVSEHLPESWVKPATASATELMTTWHFEDHLLVARAPVSVGTFRGTVEIARSLEAFERLNKIVLLVMAGGALIAAVVSGAAGMLLARQLVRPVAALADTMRTVRASGRLRERVPFHDNGDELSKLSSMFNEMMDRLETAFEQQKQFVDDAAHELRTPIAIIEGHLALLQRWGKDDPHVLEESLAASLYETRRLRDLTQNMLSLSQAESLVAVRSGERIDPVPILKRITDDFALLHPDFTFELLVDPLSGARPAVGADHFRQIMMIVLDNAVHYSGEHKRVTVAGAVTKEGRMELRVTDYGMGIPEQMLPYVFDRFYRVDTARSRRQGGSGLGLSIAKRLTEAYRGRISIASRERGGTTVTLTFE